MPWTATPSHRRAALGALVLLASLALALALPRGAQSGPTGALTALLALACGVVAGRAWPRTGARWAGRWWVLPLWAVGQLVRLRLPGVVHSLPDLGALLGGSTFALGALLCGAGVDVLLGLVPLAAGLALGASRRQGRVVAASSVAVAIGVLVAVALVPPRVTGGADVAGVETLRIDGCDQRLVVRGKAGGPVVLFLSGGPGGTELGTLARQWREIEREFLVVVWDQTGAGLNGRCFPRDGRLTLDGLRHDGAAVLAEVTARHGRPIVVGNSWGTFLGVLLARDNPTLVRAFVGSGQMADLTATDRLFHADALAWADRTGQTALADRLRRQGPPPYASVFDAEVLFATEGGWNAWDRNPAVGAAVNPVANVWDIPELGWVEKLRYPANILDTFSVLYPQLDGVDLRREAARLEVPVYLAQGVHEARGRQELARAWFDGLDAPTKEWVEFARSGHKAFGEEPDAFLALLRRVAG